VDKSRFEEVLKTEGNFNNLVGLPLTLLRLHKSNKVAVVELGTNRQGDPTSGRDAAPDMELSRRGCGPSRRAEQSGGVAREKGALRGFGRRMIAVNLDDQGAPSSAKIRGKKITYGEGGQVRAESWRSSALKGRCFISARVVIDPRPAQFLGEHNIVNATGAAAMAYGFGASLAAIRRFAEDKPFPMRMQLGTGGK
jgi:UDP-N-acetylmuramyl pentapeptide synthase